MKKQGMVTEKQVEMAVLSWSIRFREIIYSPDELALLAREYHEDLVDEEVTVNQFVGASKTVRRRAKWFPKVADIMEAVREYRANPPPLKNSLMIEADTRTADNLTPEEIQRNKQRIKIYKKLLRRKITPDQANDEMQELGLITEFGNKSKKINIEV